MRIAVLGCGAIGSCVARLLLKEKFVDEIVCFDRNLRRARSFLEEREIEVKKLDVKEKGRARTLLKGFDWLINALPTFSYLQKREVPLNPIVLSHALACGANYMDFACYGMKNKAEQLCFHEKFEENGLVGLINSGASPGLSNVLAKEASKSFEKVERIEIRTFEEQEGKRFVPPWSKEELFDIGISSATVFLKGRFVKERIFKRVALYDFPKPFGKRYCYLVPHDEVFTLPYFVDTGSLLVMSSGSDVEILRALYRLGMLSDKEINLGKIKVAVGDFIASLIPNPPAGKKFLRLLEEGVVEDGVFGIFVDVYGSVSNRQARSRYFVIFPSQKKILSLMPGATYISYPTSVCALSFLKAFLKKGRGLKGIFPPENLPRHVRKKALEELKNNGIIVNFEYKIVKLEGEYL